MADDLFGIVGTMQGGAFRVDEVVAEGGFAVVYRAYHDAFRSNVALKCLKIPRALSEGEQAEFLEKFREEAELLFRLSSAIPSVVRPLQFGTLAHTKGRFVPFIALEWLEGQTLDKLVSTRALAGQPPLEIATAVRMLTPVADALCRAHRLPTNDGVVTIIHRDLKPENIFLANVLGKKITKVLDFGIAKVKSAATQVVGKQSAAESPLAAFTPAYGSPEQWLPKRYGQTGPWTDVWGLALTVVEAICGHAPFFGEPATMMVQALDVERRPTPRNEGVRLPDSVEAIFAKALAVDPRDRYGEVGPFWNELCEAVGLPQVVGDRSPSLAPPPSPAPAPPSADIRSAPTLLDRSQVAVPDLIAAPSPKAAPAPSRQTPRGEAKGGLAVRPGKLAEGPSRVEPAVGALFGATLDVAEDAAPKLRLETDAPARVRSRALGAPLPAAGFVRGRPAAKKLNLAAPLKLLGLAILLMAGDYAYATVAGEVLRFGPARVVWVAGPLAALGAILLVSRLLGADE
jgi:serine/threonine-protein kinase